MFVLTACIASCAQLPQQPPPGINGLEGQTLSGNYFQRDAVHFKQQQETECACSKVTASGFLNGYDNTCHPTHPHPLATSPKTSGSGGSAASIPRRARFCPIADLTAPARASE